MERYRLKNIIIIILALVNVFLLGSLMMRQTSRQTTRRNLEAQLVELFAADGMELNTGAIPSEAPPALLHMTRDTAREQEAARLLLGESVDSHDQGGGIYSYAGENGAAVFRENGGFEMAGTLASGDAEKVCRDFCEMFSYDEPVFQLDEEGNGTAVAACLFDGRSVLNGTVVFSFEQGTLRAVSGTLLPESGVDASGEQKLLTGVAALTAFQNVRRESGAVVSAVTEMYDCYRLQSSTTAPMALVPAWCIVTDTSLYYVNCLTGAVTTS